MNLGETGVLARGINVAVEFHMEPTHAILCLHCSAIKRQEGSPVWKGVSTGLATSIQNFF